MNVQKERKNLVDDLPPVDSACKLTEGLLSALYLWCTLFEMQVFMFILTVIVEDASSYYNFHRHNVERLKVWAGDFGEGGVWCFIYKFGL